LIGNVAKEGIDPSTKNDGYTAAQRYFIGFGPGVGARTRASRQPALRAKTDPHSAGMWRVNGSVQNFDEFGKAFGCKVAEADDARERLPRLVGTLDESTPKRSGLRPGPFHCPDFRALMVA